MSKSILRSIALLLASGGSVATTQAMHLAEVQAFIAKLPVDQVLEMARTLMGA